MQYCTNENQKSYRIEKDNEQVSSNAIENVFGEVVGFAVSSEKDGDVSHAEIFAEALTIKDETGFSPAEILKQRNDLLSALRAITYQENGGYFTGYHGDSDVSKHVAQAIENAS